MSQIHLVGLDHFLQNQHEISWTVAGRESEQRQKREFEALLRGLVQQQRIELVAEEGTFDDACLGCRLARELRLNYVNITMPQSERDQAGIPNNYEDREDTRAAAIAAFEVYMSGAVNNQRAQRSLVLCGRLHIEGLRSAFEKAGHTVQPYDVAAYDWFQGRPIESDQGVIGYDR
jgi:hypothetical protein